MAEPPKSMDQLTLLFRLAAFAPGVGLSVRLPAYSRLPCLMEYPNETPRSVWINIGCLRADVEGDVFHAIGLDAAMAIASQKTRRMNAIIDVAPTSDVRCECRSCERNRRP